MKNIHILPTDKAGRLLYNSTLKSFCFQKEKDEIFINDGKVSGADFWGLEKALNNGFQPHNIYITSDEEIKKGDWVYSEAKNTLFKVKSICNTSAGYLLIEDDVIMPLEINEVDCKKIILTTDQDLIDDGVQAIDDEFLEWFVNNPSCESIEVVIMNKGYNKLDDYPYQECYKINIPKEELECEHPYRLREYYNENAFKCFECNKITVNNNIKESNRDSLEYGILQHIKLCLECNNESQAIRLLEKYGFEKQEEMYNAEDMAECWNACYDCIVLDGDINFEDFMKQFKKK